MRFKKLLYGLSVVLAIFLLMGCVPDDGPTIGPGDPEGQVAHRIEIRLGVLSNASGSGSSSRTNEGVGTGPASRVNSDYSDVNMQAGELMRNWLVVIVDKDRKIVDIVENGKYESGETERAQDTFWERMTAGTIPSIPSPTSNHRNLASTPIRREIPCQLISSNRRNIPSRYHRSFSPTTGQTSRTIIFRTASR